MDGVKIDPRRHESRSVALARVLSSVAVAAPLLCLPVGRVPHHRLVGMDGKAILEDGEVVAATSTHYLSAASGVRLLRFARKTTPAAAMQAISPRAAHILPSYHACALHKHDGSRVEWGGLIGLRIWMDGRSLSDARSTVNHSPFSSPESCARLRLPPLPGPGSTCTRCHYNMSTASERDNAALIRFVLLLTPAEVDCTMARFIKKGHERKGLHSDVRSKGWIPGWDSGRGGRAAASFGALCARLAVAEPLDIDI